MRNYETKKAKIPFFGLGKIMPYLKPFWKSFLFILVMGLLASADDVIMPLFQKHVLNKFIGERDFSSFGIFIVLYLLAVLMSGVLNGLSTLRATQTEAEINNTLRGKLFAHLQTMSFSYFNQNSIGSVHARLMSDTSRIGSLASWNLLDAVMHLTYIVGATVIMLILNARLAVLVLSVIPLLVLFFALFQKIMLRVDRALREQNAKITGDFNEGITGAKTIKTLTVEKKIIEKFQKGTSSMLRKSVKSARVHGIFSAVMTFASSTALAIVIWKGGYIAADEIGTFSAFMSYAIGISEPVRWLVEAISSLIQTQVNIERVTGLLEMKPEVSDSPEVIEKYGDTLNPKRENWEALRGDIEIRNVSFRYPDGQETVLDNFSLDIPLGTHVAIVGETGAGKSTLINLICRFYDPTEGEILMDGKNLKERSLLWLHSSIGYVLQTPHLFSGTVRENLLMGKPDATDEEIENALRTVSAWGIIEHLEDGLDTDVGENGSLLSTGEKQLIAFARAIVADPAILILDEATASVDTVTEQKIQGALEAVTKGRTTLVVAHRLSTVVNSDVILVVREGKIVERGTHKELLGMNGYYKQLYMRQFEDEETEKVLG